MPKAPLKPPVAPDSIVGKRLRAHAPALLGLVPLALVEVALDGGITLSYKFLIDRAIVPADGHVLTVVLSFLGAGVLVGSLLAIWRDLLHARLVTKILNDLRRAVFDYAMKLSVGFYTGRSTADVVSRFSSDLVGLEGALIGAVSGVLLPGLGVLMGTSLLFFVLDWRLALIGTFIWPLVLIGPRIIAPRAAAASYEKKRAEAAMLARIDEAAAAHRVVKSYGLGPFVRARFEKSLLAVSESATRSTFLGSLVERSTVVTIYLLQVAMIAVGGVMAYRHTISVGSLVSFLTIFWNLGWSLVVLGRSAPNVVSAFGAVRRVDELFAERADAPDPQGAIELAPLHQDIVFKSVVFGYPGRGIVLMNASFRIESGELVAFVGPSGSGKSTILNLMSRFFDPMDGSIFFDGTELRQATVQSLRDQTAVVFQDTFLFDTTIRDNIALAKPGATTEQIETAAKKAEIHDAILAFPDGYETQVGDRGALLSGGQRQRLSLARAMLRDPKLLLLDEATSALDPATESAINETLFQAAKGRTTMVVTHRLDSVTRADRIYVIDAGRIVEHGTHDELLEADDHYAELWRKQHGFIISEDGSSAEVSAERLREIALLKPLGDDQLETLARQFVSTRVSAGGVVIREGEEGNLLYVIARGAVGVTHKTAAGEVKEVARLSDGDQFGEMALLNNAPRSATVTARTDCVFLTLTGQHFRALLEATPAVKKAVERIAKERTAKLNGTPMARTLCL